MYHLDTHGHWASSWVIGAVGFRQQGGPGGSLGGVANSLPPLNNPPLPMPAIISPLDTRLRTTHVANRKAHAEALLEEFAVAWLGHKRSKVAWVQTDRALEDLCTRVFLFLDPEDQP
jgi:hypothetical protein